MKATIKKLFFILLFLLSILFPLQSSLASNEDSSKHTIISFDGMRHDLTEEYIDSGMLPNFKKVKKTGLMAEDIRTIYPSLTMSSHAAISTGAMPAKTGMISNHLREPQTDLTDNKSAFFSPLDAAPIWSEARKQGKTTATVLFPGSDPKEGHKATYAVYLDTPWAESALESLEFTLPNGWTELPESYSPVKEATLTVELKDADNQEIYILATDSIDEGIADYDTFYFYTEINGEVIDSISEKEWGSISFLVKGKQPAGFSLKLKDLDPTLKDIKLYRTEVTSAVVDGPTQFQKDIASKFGYLPAEYDDEAFDKEWITRSEYEEIQEKFAKWTTDVSLYIKEEYEPDLLFVYYPQIDHEEHKYLLVDPMQLGYTKSKSKEYMNYIKWSYKLADKKVGEFLETMDDNDQLLLVSDHGMEPVHTMISPNHELEKAELLVRDDDGKIDSKKSKAFAVASGAIAHVYINLEGREQSGIVSEEDFPEVQKEITSIFNKFEAASPTFFNRLQYLYYRRDHESQDKNERSVYEVLLGWKENPFEKVVSAGEEHDMDILDHEQAGDVLLIAKRGYYIGQDDEVSTVNIATERGNHGGDPERKELRPIFYLTGSHYSEAKITDKISTLDIAPTLYELLGLKTPDFVDGKVISEMLAAENN